MDVREAAVFLQSGDERKMSVVEVPFGCVNLFSKKKNERKICRSWGRNLRKWRVSESVKGCVCKALPDARIQRSNSLFYSSLHPNSAKEKRNSTYSRRMIERARVRETTQAAFFSRICRCGRRRRRCRLLSLVSSSAALRFESRE